jgi:hypothetical protein
VGGGARYRCWALFVGAEFLFVGAKLSFVSGGACSHAVHVCEWGLSFVGGLFVGAGFACSARLWVGCCCSWVGCLSFVGMVVLCRVWCGHR